MKGTKRKIFETSIELFAKKGYEATSIDEITAVVGVAKGTLYYHFNSKEDIFRYLIEQGMDLLKKSIYIKTRHTKGALEKLRRVIEIQIKIIIKYEEFMLLLLSHIWGNEKRNLVFRQYVFEYIEEITKVIEEGKAEGVIRNGDSEVMASGIFGLICSAMIYKLKMKEQIDIKCMTEQFISYITVGIGN
jgi:AcrR family transcriptional regulator